MEADACGYGMSVSDLGIRNGDFRAVKIRTESFVQGHPGVEFDIGKVHFQIPAPGIFTVYNALAAVRVCMQYGVTPKTAAGSLLDFQVKGRMQFSPSREERRSSITRTMP